MNSLLMQTDYFLLLQLKIKTFNWHLQLMFIKNASTEMIPDVGATFLRWWYHLEPESMY